MKELHCLNESPCACPHTSCENHGICCQCVASHRGKGNLPMCLR